MIRKREKVYITNPSQGNNYVLKGEWVHSKPESFSQDRNLFSRYEHGKLRDDWLKIFYLPAVDEIYALAKVASGMSGSPLLTDNLVNEELDFENKKKSGLFHTLSQVFAKQIRAKSENLIFVLGVTKSSDRFVPGSWFTTEKSITNKLENYLNNQRGLVSNTKWKLRYGLTFREYDPRNAEVFTFDLKKNEETSLLLTSGHSRCNLGGFERGDNGGHERVDSGGHERADNGLKEDCSLSDLVYDFQFWKHFQIYPGFKYEDQHVIDINIAKDHIFVFFAGPPPQNEVIHFILDQYGRLLDENHNPAPLFTPYITIKSKTDKLYFIDLRSLFFVNTSNYIEPNESPGLFKTPRDPKFTKHHLERLLVEGPILRIRSEDSPQIYDIQFNRVE